MLLPKSLLTFAASLLLTAVFAQQPILLDFEKMSVEGPVRPWGWLSYVTSPKFQVHMDTLAVHGGKYSLRMPGNSADEMQEIRYFIEPYALAGKNIRIDGWVKTVNLKGDAFFMVSYHDETREWKSDTVAIKTSGSTDWTLISLTKNLPANTLGCYLSLCLSGKGVAWFDDFSLWIDNKSVQEVEVAPAFSNKQMQWLEKAAAPLFSVDAVPPGTPAAFKDLKTFGEIVGDARIIALGEATHGTSEFFRLKNRLLSYAVEQLGVRVFAIEDNQLVVEKVNNYVLEGIGTARGCMYGMFGVWQNQEVLDLIKWIRAYNVKHPADKVAFRGFDVQNLDLPLDSLSRFLKQQDTALLATVTDLLADLKNGAPNIYMADDSTKQAWFLAAQQALELVMAQKQPWLASAETPAAVNAIEWGIQYARLVKQFAESMWKGHLSLYRDVAMAENISWLLERYPPGTRMVIWAHDFHISRGEDPVAENNYYNGISMGAHLAKKYGKAYRAFGIFTYTGSFRAQPSYMDFSQIICPLLPGPRGTADEALHRVALRKKSPALLLDLRQARQQPWLAAPLPIRFANHVSVEYSYWTRYSLPYQFDGLLFVDETSAAKAAAKD